MPGHVCPLASGSLGNALLVASARARVLVDLGLGPRRLGAALDDAGAGSGGLDAVFLTHTHRDHFAAAAVGFCLRHRTPVYSAAENLGHLAATMPGFAALAGAGLARPMDGEAVRVGDIRVEAFDLPHDAPGRCLGFRLTLGPARARRAVAVATDLGHLSAEALAALLDADVLVLESNHDPGLLRGSGRPWDLIERIAGPHGHLSNDACAEAVAEVVGRSRAGRVRHVVLAHLSRDCNTPRLALEAQAHLARRSDGPRVSAAGQYEAGPFLGV